MKKVARILPHPPLMLNLSYNLRHRRVRCALAGDLILIRAKLTSSCLSCCSKSGPVPNNYDKGTPQR